jgi:hypothetical protein
MVDFDYWLNDTEAISSNARAVMAWRRIQDKPTSITIIRLATAQTVRVEYGETGSEQTAAPGTGTRRNLTIFGIRDHPTETDTNIKAGDRFVLDNQEYRVLDIVKTIGEIQARCEVVS